MKTSNVEPFGNHAADSATGRRSTNLAGAKGMVWRDPVTESVGQIRDMTVIGATLTDNEDGTGVLTIGAGGQLIPEATITDVTKATGNPTFNFASLPENIVKVGSTYYCPYTSSVTGDVKLATASDRDGPWAAGSTIFTQASVLWDASASLYAPEIVEHAGTYYLFYSMIVAAGATSASNAIGVATAPAITGPYTDFGTAVLSPGAAGVWDSRRVGEPSVIFQAGQWVMAYMGEDSDIAYQASEQIGIATAPAATGPWTKAAGNPLLPFGASGEFDDALVADPCLFFFNGYYWMMYAGGIDAGPSTRAEQGLAYASTPTGTWTRFAGNPILTVGAGGTWDDVWVFRGGLLYESGTWSGVYCGYDGANFKGGNFTLDIDSAAVSLTPTASDIPIDDGGGYYAGSEVEAALQEIGADLSDISPRLIIVDAGANVVDSSTPFGVTVTTKWGVTSAGVPYYDTTAADSGDEAALVWDPDIDTYALIEYDF